MLFQIFFPRRACYAKPGYSTGAGPLVCSTFVLYCRWKKHRQRAFSEPSGVLLSFRSLPKFGCPQATGLSFSDIGALGFRSAGIGRVPSTYAMSSFSVMLFSRSFDSRFSSDTWWARATASSTFDIVIKRIPKTSFGGPYGLDYLTRERITRRVERV